MSDYCNYHSGIWLSIYLAGIAMKGANLHFLTKQRHLFSDFRIFENYFFRFNQLLSNSERLKRSCLLLRNFR